MAKQTGLAANFYIAGYDLSGDVASLDNIDGSVNPLDVTAINKSAFERLGGERDGVMEFTTFFDPAAGAEHAALSPLPTTDVVASFFLPALAVGAPACSINAKQVNYDWTRGNDGSLTGKVSCQANGYGLEWGEALTAGLRTDPGATVGTFWDDTAASSFGGQAYFQVTAFSGTSVTIDIQSATSSGGSYTTTGLTSSALVAIGAQRVQVANNVTINRYLKVVTTGTFSSATFSVMFVRNPLAVVF